MKDKKEELDFGLKVHCLKEKIKYGLKAKKEEIKSFGMMTARPNFTMNPLLKWPRNNNCVCGSGKKFKKCCLNELARQITIEDATKINNRLKKHGIRLA